MPPVPYNPEPLSALRERLPRAMEHVYDVAAIINGGIRPGEVAANVFDFENGLRLIVSREQKGTVRLHVSASFRPDSPMARDVRSRLAMVRTKSGANLVKEKWRKEVEPTVRLLFADPDLDLDFIGFSEGMGIPHWIVKGEW